MALFDGRVTPSVQLPGREARRVCFQRNFYGNVRQFVQLLGAAASAMSYPGQWSVQLSVLDIGEAEIDVSNWDTQYYPDDHYLASIELPIAAFIERPGHVTHELLGGFTRATPAFAYQANEAYKD